MCWTIKFNQKDSEAEIIYDKKGWLIDMIGKVMHND